MVNATPKHSIYGIYGLFSYDLPLNKATNITR